MNDFVDLRAALAAYHAAEYPNDRDVALARLGAAATPEVVQRLLDESDRLAYYRSSAVRIRMSAAESYVFTEALGKAVRVTAKGRRPV